MTAVQKIIKVCAVAFAVCLIVSIVSGIAAAAGMLSGAWGKDSVDFTSTTYALSGDIRRLVVEVGAADFSVVEADAFSVESNLSRLSVDVRDGTLRIIEKKVFGASYEMPHLTLFVPAGFVFAEAEIETGAGAFSAEVLSADRIELSLGAGEVRIDALNAGVSADIEGGAGAIFIGGGVLRNLDFEMGVGELSLTAALLGESELNYGVGETNLTLVGSKEDYCIDFEKGIGSITVDGETLTGLGKIVYGRGENRIEIDGGVGSIRVQFSEK